MITVHDIPQGTAEWHDLRRGKYTGSNAHKLLKHGARPYSLTTDSEFAGSFWTKRGHLLEEEAIELYETITGTKVARPGFITNDKYPDCGYSPDGLTDDLVIEVKCFDKPKHLALLSGELPLTVVAQIHFGMMICERRQARLLIYNPKLDPLKAFNMFVIKSKPAIQSNFKRILKGKALHGQNA